MNSDIKALIDAAEERLRASAGMYAELGMNAESKLDRELADSISAALPSAKRAAEGEGMGGDIPDESRLVTVIREWVEDEVTDPRMRCAFLVGVDNGSGSLAQAILKAGLRLAIKRTPPPAIDHDGLVKIIREVRAQHEKILLSHGFHDFDGALTDKILALIGGGRAS